MPRAVRIGIGIVLAASILAYGAYALLLPVLQRQEVKRKFESATPGVRVLDIGGGFAGRGIWATVEPRSDPRIVMTFSGIRDVVPIWERPRVYLEEIGGLSIWQPLCQERSDRRAVAARGAYIESRSR